VSEKPGKVSGKVLEIRKSNRKVSKSLSSYMFFLQGLSLNCGTGLIQHTIL
jgi:hypothetical protein